MPISRGPVQLASALSASASSALVSAAKKAAHAAVPAAGHLNPRAGPGCPDLYLERKRYK